MADQNHSDSGLNRTRAVESPGVRYVLVIAIALLLIITVFIIANRDNLPTLQEMDIAEREQSFRQLATGEPWTPGTLDAEGYAAVYSNDSFELLLAPETTQVAVRNKHNGFLWRSNPTKDNLKDETVKGLQLSNLQSPFILEYVPEGKTQRSMTNTLEKKLETNLVKTEQGVEVTYHFTKLQLDIVIRYELTEHGLEVTIPSQGIVENGDARLLSVQLLPFFGAVSGTQEQGYLFVPDGPGGLLYYDRERPAIGNRYDYAIYDENPANLQEREVPREMISYPVFGLKRGDQAYAAIVKEGKASARITAMPAGVQTTYHSIGAKFVYRDEYLRKVSKMAPPVNTVQKERIHQDRQIEYRLLSEDEADYSGMAATYRNYLLVTKQLPEALPETSHTPMLLGLVGGGTEDVFGGKRFMTATTFEQAEQIATEFSDAGIRNMRVQFQGWQAGGFSESDRRFPIKSELGGTEGAKRFALAMKERGIPVIFEDDLAWMKISNTDISMKTEGIRSIDTTVFHDRLGTRFLLNPVTAVRTAKETVDQLGALGISGIYYHDAGSTLFGDYANPGLEREDTAHLYSELLAYTKERLGHVATERGNDYVLQASDWLTYFPMESSYDFFVDETVPFYPMAVHGSLLYTGTEANLRNEYDKELLRAIEYGAIPFFRLTYERSRELKGTDHNFLYSGEYAVWKDRVIEEYKKFEALAPLVHRRMIEHHKQAEGVYVMTYDDGSQVLVDYNKNRFEVTRGGASS